MTLRGCIGKLGLLFNCLGERRCEGRPRSHFRKPIASVCHVTQRCERAFAFAFVLSQLGISLCLRWMTKSSNVPTSRFTRRSENPLPKPFKCFVRLWRHSFSRTAVSEWHSHFKAGRVSIEDDEHSVMPSSSKTTEKLRTHPRRPSPNNP
jgi:hypothetical protein